MDIDKEIKHQAQSETPGKITQGVFEWAEELVIAIALVAVIFTFIFRIITVDGSSMEPNFLDSDRVLVSDIMFDLKQGDVIVVTNVLEGPIIKRVIATEGQTVDLDIENKAILIDGIALDDTQFGISNGITTPPYSNLMATDLPQVVPEGCVFVLGDNREVSKDSRYKDVGMIDKRNILGKAVLHIFPFNRFGTV